MKEFLKRNVIALFGFVFVCNIIYVVDLKNAILTMDALVGNTAENLAAIKHECEKDLPRNQECVLVYDYVPVNKE